MKNLQGFFKTGDFRAEYNLTDDQSAEIVSKILEWCEKYGATLGEVIRQSDDCIMSAPELLASIVDDIIKFRIIDEGE